MLKEITYKKGVLDGMAKVFDEDENLIKEIPYKNGKQNGTATIYDKKALNGFTKGTVDYVDDKMVVSRLYMDNNIVYFQQVLAEGNTEIDRAYNILREISKDLNKTILPKLQAKYEKTLNDAIKKRRQRK